MINHCHPPNHHPHAAVTTNPPSWDARRACQAICVECLSLAPQRNAMSDSVNLSSPALSMVMGMLRQNPPVFPHSPRRFRSCRAPRWTPGPTLLRRYHRCSFLIKIPLFVFSLAPGCCRAPTVVRPDGRELGGHRVLGLG